MTFSREEAIAALEVLLGGRSVPDGFRLVDVRHAGPDVLVLFRWRRVRHIFGIVFPWSGAFGLSTGEPVRSVEEWASEAWLSLTEELDTGYVTRALRRQKTGYVQLCDQAYEFDRRYYVSPVPGDGSWLAHCGWNVDLARRLRDGGQLIAWLQVNVNNERGEPVVGQAVVARQLDGDAELAVLDVATGVPDVVSQDLARAAVQEAGDDGAVRMRASSAHSQLLSAMGFEVSTKDGTWVDTSGLPTDR